ncbi:hypothetical protein [Pendulispora albinea]|uniref:Lipoprotein n=1 Tax=Pendulispora albinea TaxID=2741071 RepID=A0ABZ2M4D4_9BACT
MNPRFGWRFSFCLACLVSLFMALAGGLGCKKSDATPDAGQVAEPPVPAPEGLLAEAVVVDPNGSWGKVQRGTGGALSLMPMTLGGLVTSLASLDPALGPEIDGTGPAFGALAAGPSGMESIGYAIAVHLLDERRTRGTLFEGPNARYAGRDAAGLTLLVPKAGAPLPVAIALARGGFLVLARNEADLARLGPYVARTLPARPLPTGSIVIDVPRSAFTGPLAPYLASLWSSFRAEMEQKDARMREAHGGKAPDFGDPRAIVEMSDAFVKSKMGILGDLSRARIVIDAIDEGIRVVATLVPVAGDGPAARAVRAMRVGDAAPLLDVPKASSMALLLRSDAEERKETAHDAAQAVIKALGERIDADGREKLERALGDWAKGRGDDVSGAWLGGERGGLLVRAPVADAESAARGLRGLVGLGEKTAFKGPLETFLHVQKTTSSQVDVPGLGKVDLVLLTRGEAKDAKSVKDAKDAKDAKDPKALSARVPPGGAGRGALAGPAQAGVAWAIGSSAPDAAAPAPIQVALAEDPIALLRDVTENPGKAGQDADVAAAVKRLGSKVTLALVMRRTAIEPARSGGGLALVVGWGREANDGSDARAYLEASHALVREGIRRLGGF